jgi:hypothetical protein
MTIGVSKALSCVKGLLQISDLRMCSVPSLCVVRVGMIP